MAGPSYSRGRDRDHEPTREERQERDFKRVLSRPRSESSLARYDQKYRLLTEADQDPIAYCEERKLGRRTFYVLKAAYQHGLAKDALEAIREGDRAKADQLHKRLVASSPDYGKRRFLDGRSRSLAPAWDRGTRRPARRGLTALPGNWREMVQNTIPEKYQDVGLVSALTGCRPDEIQQGATVKAGKDSVSITLHGSKTGQGYGQDLRSLTFNLDTPLAKQLHARVQGSPELYVQAPAGAWSKAFRVASQKGLGLNRGPYMYRQQVAADLKVDFEGDKQTIALAMGHSSERSQSEYGTKNQARGGGGNMVSVTASRPAKPAPSFGSSGPSHAPR